MRPDDLPLLIFTRDGNVEAFHGAAEAAGWLESIDVIDGEYPAAYSVEGHVVTLVGQRNGPVTVTVTGDVDREDLLRRLAVATARIG